MIREIKPDFQDVGYYFGQYLEKYIKPDSRLLDIGCGHNAFGHEYYRRAAERVGLDPDFEALQANDLMDRKINCLIEDTPADIGQFDVIVAQWVLEHLSDPEKTASALERLAKPGAYFIFMTTNIYSPLILASKILPTRVKKFLRHKLLGINENDTYPTQYKMNTPAKIDKILSQHGFERVSLKTTGVLSYFTFNNKALRVKVEFDKLFGKISRFDTHIVGVYQKRH